MTIRERRQGLGSRTGRLLGVTAVAVLALGFAATPAMAFTHIKNEATGACLTSDSGGHVYVSNCTTTNRDQDWSNSYPSLTLVNVGTGQCLDDNHHQGIFTEGCGGAGSDPYRMWFGLFYGAGLQLWDNETGQCIDDNHHQGLFMNTCTNGNTAPLSILKYQLWLTSFPVAP